MKGCLKFSSTLAPAHDSQGQHHNEHPEAHSYHAPTTTTPLSTTSCPATTASSSTDAAHTTTPSQAHTQTHRKCVAFCAEGSETVYPADEWDRTPAEPARKLSYQDLLELKEIQRSLPHANQPADMIAGRPGKQFLMGVPIVLLPLLSSSPTESGEHSSNGAQEAVPKKPCHLSDAPSRTNASTGWSPPSLTRQTQTTPARQSFPFPPRPVPLPGPALKPTFASPTTLPSYATQPPQSPNKTGSASSPTSPYPSSCSNRPSTTSTSAKFPYSSFHQRTQAQTQSRTSWTPPSSLSHLMPSLPTKPREKPKFEFITLLDPAGTDRGSDRSPSDGPNGVEVTTTEVRPKVPPFDSLSKLPSGLTEIESELERDHPDDDHDLEDHDQDHDLTSVTSSSPCPSLCASCCPSSSASEVESDHEHEIVSKGRSRFLKGFSAKSSLSSSFPSPPFDFNVGLLPLAEEVERHMTKKKPEPKKKKERKFILVNDMKIELDDSGSESEEEEDPTPLSASITSTNTSTTREITTTTTTKTITTITTTTSSSESPRSIIAPVPVKSTLLGSQPPSPSLSASLITPPITPPSEQISRSGSRNNKLHSPSSPSSASRGRTKKATTTTRERSGSTGSDTAAATSPTRNAMTGMCLPVKFKSKMSQEAAGLRI